MVVLGPGKQDAEGEEGKTAGLEGAAGQCEAAPLHQLPEVVGSADILKETSCVRIQGRAEDSEGRAGGQARAGTTPWLKGRDSH